MLGISIVINNLMIPVKREQSDVLISQAQMAICTYDICFVLLAFNNGKPLIRLLPD